MSFPVLQDKAGLRGAARRLATDWENTGRTSPWSGRVVCPGCGSADWTLPYNGRSEPGPWRCVWPCHRFFPVDFDADYNLVATAAVPA